MTLAFTNLCVCVCVFWRARAQVEEAIEMYQTLHRWDEAIAVAEARAHPEAANMRQQYFQYLVESNQEVRSLARASLCCVCAAGAAVCVSLERARDCAAGAAVGVSLGRARDCARGGRAGAQEKAAALKEAEGDFLTAINLYLKGGLPAKAVAVVNARPAAYSGDLLEKITLSLQVRACRCIIR